VDLQVSGLLTLLQPLIADTEANKVTEDSEELADEQALLGRLVHLFKATTSDEQYKILTVIRKNFGAGGEYRIKYTLPPLVFAALQLARVYFQNKSEDELWSKKTQKIFQFCHQVRHCCRH
jgi:vacuolar protein sorting-associated protein 35